MSNSMFCIATSLETNQGSRTPVQQEPLSAAAARVPVQCTTSGRMSDVSNQYGYHDPIERLFESGSPPSRSRSKYRDPIGSFPEFRDKEHSYTKNRDGSQKSKRHYYDLPDSHGEDKVSDLKKRLAAKDVYLQEMKEELEKYKERCARQSSHVQSLKEHIKEFDHTASEKAEISAEKHSLRRENKELTERIKELENRLRLHLIEREKAEQKSTGLGNRLQECVERLSSCLNIDFEEHEDPLDALVRKVEKLMKEYIRHKSRVTSLEDALASQEVESKASRDTIVKLVAESEKRKKAMADHPAEVTFLKRERDEAVLARKNIEREKEILQEKLKDNHKEWGSFRQELMEKEKKINDLERTLHTSDYGAKASHSLHQSFIGQLATILSNGFTTVPRTEEAVKERIQELCSSEQTWKSTCEDLRQKIEKLNKQIEKQLDLYHESMAKSYKAEELLQEHQNSMKHLKGKLVSEEMIKDGFNMERKRLKKFLLQLAEKMKISQDISSESLVSQYDMLLNRADEICKRDKEFLSENKTLIYNLQKKVNSQRENLELKSSQIEQLEKKIKQHGREKEHQTFLNAENSTTMTAQKLQKKVERLQGQLSDMKIANQNLTAQLVDMNDLKEIVNQQKKTIELLSKSLEKLEKIKEKAAKKVVSLKTELDYTEHESVGEKVRCQQVVEAVTNELHTAKRALEEVARREKQLVDFRETITRMMGFNINTLAVPDHEIFDQLKRVLRTHGPIDNTKMDRSKLPYGFRTGIGEQEYTVQHMNPRY
ncbi:coiled-coil domain-containing protein 170-like isoform X2 [Bufo bufo]|uniref:coiled-coil domain-containing protein 170-like isoform X2 n=1 Tax=Bufo bufo TaxID=8384 RepID=UPI001ABECE2F|nr:coiled-coil domain-containing protein 170-like isoform X2 [Bufo bufo]